jgi:hypothetical protein
VGRGTEVGQPSPAEDRRAVGRASTQPGTRRDPLEDPHRGHPVDHAQGPDREVLLGWPDVDRLAGRGIEDLDRAPTRRRRGVIVDRELDGVGQVEADHLGIDQVVPVVASTGDPQRQRELRRGMEGDEAGVGGHRRLSVERAAVGPRRDRSHRRQPSEERREARRNGAVGVEASRKQ